MDLKPKSDAQGNKVLAGQAPPPMKLTFVEVKYKKPITLPKEFVTRLPKKVILFTNIQYHPQYDKLKSQLEAGGKEVITVRPKHAWKEGQILGCSIEDWSSTGVEGFVYVG
ncbi:2-(3-amino-3-carboxypropyl)histidine synthase, partial [Candidatus Woesearchaeota archaeon]|nr:2-(3-amino-3-carboxypropyl)histidine synthase [Candidatus Woesearchaeota archaeon]